MKWDARRGASFVCRSIHESARPCGRQRRPPLSAPKPPLRRSRRRTYLHRNTEVIEDRILQLGCQGIKYIGYIHVSHRLTRKEFVFHRSASSHWHTRNVLFVVHEETAVEDENWSDQHDREQPTVLVGIHLKTTTASQRVVKYSHGHTENFTTYSYKMIRDT